MTRKKKMDTVIDFGKIGRTTVASVLIGGWILSAAPAYADGRSSALASDFMFFCMRGTPTYESIDVYANALKLPIKKDLSRDLGHGDLLRSRSWTVGSNTGPYELAAAEAIKGSTTTESCGIGSTDASGNEIYTELAEHSNLGASKNGTSPDGQIKTAVWTLSPGQELVLKYAIGHPGFYLSRVQTNLPAR